MKNLIRALFLIILFVGAGLVAMPQQWKEQMPNALAFLRDPLLEKEIRYGLDLSGGSQLDFLVDMSRVDERIAAGEEVNENRILEGVKATLQRRIDPDGTRELNIFAADFGQEKHMFVELTADIDTPETRAKLEKHIDLQFKEPQSISQGEEKEAVREEAATVLQKIQAGGEFLQIGREVSVKNDLRNITLEEGKTFFFDEIPEKIQDSLWNASPGLLPEVIEIPTMTFDPVSSTIVPFSSFGIFSLGEKTEVNRKKVIPGVAFSEVAKEIMGEEHIFPLSELPEEKKKTIITTTGPGAVSQIFSDENGTFSLYSLIAADATSGGVRVSEIRAPLRETLEKAREKTQEKEQEVIEQQLKVDLISFQPLPSPWKETGLDGRFFSSAKVGQDQVGMPITEIVFTEEGGKIFGELTKRLVGKPMAIFVGGEFISSPIIQEEITGGAAVISFGGQNYIEDQKAATFLARDLNSGAIPAPITLVGELKIAPSLGQEALELSFQAGMVGFLLLSLFLLLQYRVLGLVASIALLFYVILFFAIIKGSSGIVLTLSGMAGILLSIGMAVDANVLVFERIREEMIDGRPFSVALSLGFDRSWSAIRDGNLTTLIICSVLILLGTSIVKGFATMLAIGVLLSLFSAMVITKLLLSFFVGRSWTKKIGLFFLRNS